MSKEKVERREKSLPQNANIFMNYNTSNNKQRDEVEILEVD